MKSFGGVFVAALLGAAALVGCDKHPPTPETPSNPQTIPEPLSKTQNLYRELGGRLGFVKGGCRECHVGITDPLFAAARPGYDDEPVFTNPALRRRLEQKCSDAEAQRSATKVLMAHPKLDLFLLADSKHPSSRVGCEICHAQEHREEDATLEQARRERWGKNYVRAHPITQAPLMPRTLLYASCFRCHTPGSSLDSSEWYNPGLLLYERSGCYACHATPGLYVREEDIPPGPDGKKDLAQKFRRPAPPLTAVASKVDKRWAFNWILHPPAFKPTARMPPFFPRGQIGWPVGIAPKHPPLDESRLERIVAACLSEYVFNISKPPELPEVPRDLIPDPRRGRMLVQTLGCLGCHRNDEYYEKDFYMLKGYTFLLEEFATNLVGSGDKFDTPVGRRWLFAWLKDPKRYFPETYMPNFGLGNQEALDILSYLLTLRVDNEARAAEGHLQWKPVDPPLRIDGDAARIDPKEREMLEYLWNYRIQREGAELAQKVQKMNDREKILAYGEYAFEFFGCYGCHPASDARRGDRDWLKMPLPDKPAGRKLVPERNIMQRMPIFSINGIEQESFVTMSTALYEGETHLKQARFARGEALVRRYNCAGCHRLSEDTFVLEHPVEGSSDLRRVCVEGRLRARRKEDVVLKQPTKIGGVEFAPEDLWVVREADGMKIPCVSTDVDEILDSLVTRGRLDPKKRADPKLDIQETQVGEQWAVSWASHHVDMTVDPIQKVYATMFPGTIMLRREVGEGGVYQRRLMQVYRPQNEEQAARLREFVPPSLRTAGRKLDPSWIAAYVRAPYDLRPRRGARMPRYTFSEEDSKAIAEYFAARDRPSVSREFPRATFEDPASRQQARAVEEMVRKSCLSCHLLEGEGSEYPKAIDLAHLGGRVRKEWLDIFLRDPSLVYPGTIMPMPPKEMLEPETFSAMLNFLADYDLLRRARIKYDSPRQIARLLQNVPRHEDLAAIVDLVVARAGTDAQFRDAMLNLLEAAVRVKTPGLGRRLEPMLAFPDAEVRWRAVESLAELGDPLVAPTIARMFGDADPQVRSAAADSLARLGAKDQAAKLATCLSDPEPDVRVAALRALTGLEAREQAPQVARALHDEDSGVRLAAVRTLVAFGARDQSDSLAALLKDSSATIRRAALSAIADLGLKSLAGRVAETLADDEIPVRRAVVQTLVALGAKSQVEAIARALSDAHPSVQAEAAMALAEFEAFDHVEAAAKLLEDMNKPLRWSVAVYLARAGDARAGPAFRELVKEKPYAWQTPAMLLQGANELSVMSRPETFARLRRLNVAAGQNSVRGWAEKLSTLIQLELAVEVSIDDEDVEFGGGDAGKLMLELARRKQVCFAVTDKALRVLPLERAMDYWSER